MFRPPVSHFEITPPAKPAITPASNGGWGSSIATAPMAKPLQCDDIGKKRAFGTRLAKGDKPFDAALFAFGDQAAALWAVQNILRDPIVVEVRENVENEINLVDKDQLCMKLLKFADEKSPQGLPIHEGKERLAAWELYAKIQSMMPKTTGIDLSKNTFVNNEMKITFVEAEAANLQLAPKVIEHEVEDLENALNVNLKLVG